MLIYLLEAIIPTIGRSNTWKYIQTSANARAGRYDSTGEGAKEHVRDANYRTS